MNAVSATRENGTVRFTRFHLNPVEALVGHSEILHFKVFDPVSKDFVHLSQMNQLIVNVINRHGRIFFLLG